jgi:hypothetical protein
LKATILQKQGDSRCKTGLSDLKDFVKTRRQNMLTMHAGGQISILLAISFYAERFWHHAIELERWWRSGEKSLVAQ